MKYKTLAYPKANKSAERLMQMIEDEDNNGYDYVCHEYTDVLKPGSSGCFGLGATPPFPVHVGFVIFKKR